jgi:hypothetical protein
VLEAVLIDAHHLERHSKPPRSRHRFGIGRCA